MWCLTSPLRATKREGWAKLHVLCVYKPVWLYLLACAYRFLDPHLRLQEGAGHDDRYDLITTLGPWQMPTTLIVINRVLQM